jgi:hypothetical protein
MAILGRYRDLSQYHPNHRVYQCAVEISTQKGILADGDDTWGTVFYRNDGVPLYSSGLAAACTDVSDYDTLCSVFDLVSDNYDMGINYGDTQN